MLAVGLAAAGVAVPALTAAASRRAAARTAPARGELAAAVTDPLSGAAELHAFGAGDAALDAVRPSPTGADRAGPAHAPRRPAWAPGS